MMRIQRLGLFSLLGALAFTVGCGCNSRQQTYAPAPPVINNAPPMGNMPVNSAPPMGSGGAMPAQANMNGAYHWRDVPANENVPVVRATFDQGGYQIYAQSGEIIAVPFENQNLHVLKFGRSQTGTMSFVNENGASPILYVPNGGYLENASASGAKWYPLPNDFHYTRPVYVAIAPSWNAWTTMGWYPGMAMYGGMWGYNPGIGLAWMPSFYVNIGGSRYNGWGGYSSYYNSNPGYMRNRVVHRSYNTARPTGRGFGTGSSGGFARSSSSSGYRSSGRSSSSGFGSSSSSGFGRSSSGVGSSRPSFGSSGSSGFGSGRSFGGSGGSFGTSRPSSGFGSSGFGSSRPSFGSSGGSSSFGRSSSGSFSGQRSTGSSFGSGRTSGGSFSGSGSSSFGSGRSFGGGGRSSFGGSSSSGRSSFGGSSGRRR